MLEMGLQFQTRYQRAEQDGVIANYNASFWLSKEPVDSWHDLGGLVTHKVSEAMLCVALPLLMVLEHSSCPPDLVNPVMKAFYISINKYRHISGLNFVL